MWSLFVFEETDFKEILKASEKEPAEINDLKGIDSDIFIKKSDIPLYIFYINSLLEQKDSQPIKAIAIKESSKVLVKELLDNPRSGEKIKEAKRAVNNLIDCIIENQDAIYDLLSLRCYDYYTYTHSINVCTLSVGLGLAINMKREDIENLGLGSMLHDIGKSEIPHEILNKQGNLSDREYKIIKTHVLAGEQILRFHENIPEESFYAVLQHHEKLSGKGYPLGLKGKDIKLFGRITAIADCYDALTTQRPYKKAFTPYFALSVIVKETGDFDPDLLKTFIRMLGKVT
jgi:HD-GYP domain-containing protein (c-di-GMP phosphodiesterase class II)